MGQGCHCSCFSQSPRSWHYQWHCHLHHCRCHCHHCCCHRGHCHGQSGCCWTCFGWCQFGCGYLCSWSCCSHCLCSHCCPHYPVNPITIGNGCEQRWWLLQGKQNSGNGLEEHRKAHFGRAPTQ